MTLKLVLNAILSSFWGFTVVSWQSKHWIVEGAIASLIIFSFLNRVDTLEERIKNLEDES